MTAPTQPVTVDAGTYIAQLSAQMSEAWGRAQGELALARAENAQRVTRETELDRAIAELTAAAAEKDRAIAALTATAAEKDRTIAELQSTLAALQPASTRP